jgi:hypothetical protein
MQGMSHYRRLACLIAGAAFAALGGRIFIASVTGDNPETAFALMGVCLASAGLVLLAEVVRPGRYF